MAQVAYSGFINYRLIFIVDILQIFCEIFYLNFAHGFEQLLNQKSFPKMSHLVRTCSGCKRGFLNSHIVTRRGSFPDFFYCNDCYKNLEKSKEDMKRKIDELELRNKKLKLMVQAVPTHIMPRTILQDYRDQKPLDYEFICSDGSIHVSQLALQHSDFYNDMCKGMG